MGRKVNTQVGEWRSKCECPVDPCFLYQCTGRRQNGETDDYLLYVVVGVVIEHICLLRLYKHVSISFMNCQLCVSRDGMDGRQ